MSDVGHPVTLPCGCFINPVVENGVNTLKISPCRSNCTYLNFVLTETGRQGKPVQKRIDP